MAEDCEEIEDDTPNIVSGEVVHSENGDISYRVLRKIGEGRCCVVYSGEATRDASLVALKFFRKGSNYEGALQREQYILDNFHDPSCNIVCCYGYLIYKGLHCLIQELLECNVRQIIFRNDRQGLSPWGTLKFARDVLTALNALHQSGLVHADLKPANIMWSSQDGCFKCLDFGLTFHIEEEDLHQIQSTGYRAPEATAWNKYKEDQKIKRKRKLQGTYLQLNYLVTPTCKDSLNLITELPEEKLSLEFASDDHPDSTRRYDPDDPPTLTRCKGSLTNPKLVRHDENEKNDQLVHSNGELSSKYGEKDQQNCVASRENENDDDGDSDSDNNIGNDNDYNMARADANQHTSKNLYRCDSESSGVFSQGSSDRSQCPSRLSCDVETMLEAAAHHECRIAAQHRLPMVEDDLTEDDQNCDKDLESSRLCAEGNPSSISEHVVMRRRNGGREKGESRRRGKEREDNTEKEEVQNNRRRGREREDNTEKEEVQNIQEWRKTRRRSEAYKTIQRKPPAPSSPGAGVDMWSFGCLLTETLTGRKLFRAGDKLTNVLRPLQLLEMRLGEVQAKYEEAGMEEFFDLVKEVIVRCLDDSSSSRLTSHAALSHALFSQNPAPSPRDSDLLPSPSPRDSDTLPSVSRLSSHSTHNQDEDLLRDIRAECSDYGEILECVVGPGGHAYVHFQEEAWLIL